MTDQTRISTRLQQLRALNRTPLNLTARELLPVDWQEPDSGLYVLALLQWGLTEEILEPDFRPGLGSLQAMLIKLEVRNPAAALEYLTTSDLGEPCSTHGT